jgi:hypothetical protein
MSQEKKVLRIESSLISQMVYQKWQILTVISKFSDITAFPVGTAMTSEVPGIDRQRKILEPFDKAVVTARVLCLTVGDDQVTADLSRFPDLAKKLGFLSALKEKFRSLKHIRKSLKKSG